MTILYEVRDWERCYTVSQNRKNDPDKPLPWVAMRTKHDGKGYRRVIRLPDSMALLGAWMLIVEVAAKCPKHGRLEDADGPLSAIDLADKTGGDEAVFQRALQVFSSQEVSWLSATTLPEHSQSIRTTGRNGTGQDGTGRNESKNPTSAPAATPLDGGKRSGSESGFDVSIVTEQTLEDPDQLDGWIDHDLTRSDTIVEPSEQFRMNVHTAAAKARTALGIRNKVAFFKWLVMGRKWSYLRIADEDVAAALRRERSKRDRSAIAGFLADFGKLPEGAR